jgi:hypothetical protein
MRVWLIIILVMALSAAARAQKPTYGFKGIHLGMTRQEVSSLLKSTKWGVQSNQGHRDDPIPTDRKFIVLDSEDPVPEPSAVKPDDFSTLGCIQRDGKRSCAYFNLVLLRFVNDRVYQIVILTSRYSQSVQDVTLYTEAAIESMVALYGDPASVEEPVESTIGKLADSDKPINIDIARWKRTTDGKQESIVVQAQKFSKAHVCDIRVMMTDDEAARQVEGR